MNIQTDIEVVLADKMNDKVVEELAALDIKIYPHKSDLFNEEDWQHFRNIFEFFWILVNGVVAGSMCLGRNLKWEDDDLPSSSPGCLYAAGLGILPAFRKQGIATFTVQWQIDYARSHGFKRLAAVCRQGNADMINIFQKSGFRMVREITDFWADPDEPAVVFELQL